MMLLLQDMRWARSEKKISCLYCEGFTNTVTAMQEGCAGCQAVLQGGREVQSVPVGPMAASPEDPMLQKLLASAVPGWCGTKELRGMGSCSHTHARQ